MPRALPPPNRRLRNFSDEQNNPFGKRVCIRWLSSRPASLAKCLRERHQASQWRPPRQRIFICEPPIFRRHQNLQR
jgi:hypothetical protein